MKLKGMSESRHILIPRWETQWFAFGPIPNEGTSATWPGKTGFSPLPLDASGNIPAQQEILGTEYRPLKVFSREGRIDFTQLWNKKLTGCPICYIMTEVTAERDGFMPVSFGASWGTQWWVNGKAVYDSIKGNMSDPGDISANQFMAPVRKGSNLFVCKVVAGVANDWNIILGKLPLVKSNTKNRRATYPGFQENSSTNLCTADYAGTGLRIEHRPAPAEYSESARRAKAMASHGVQAHWISVVSQLGIPRAPSKFLPPGKCTLPQNAAKLKRQVEEIHKNGMSAMSWYPALYSVSTAIARPEWRSVTFGSRRAGLPDKNINKELAGQEAYGLCQNSPYGEALINFTIESIEKYNLDGFWFDGTFLTYSDSPGCACAYCRKKFKKDTGLDFPSKVNWDDNAYRQWVFWRNNSYMAYWARLSSTVRRHFPHARIAVNHLHRLPHSWFSGIPLNPYAGDFIAGTESNTTFMTAFHSRLQRAYGMQHSEIWMGLHHLFTKMPSWPAACEPVNRYMHHAMCAMTAGIMPSFGTSDPAENLTDAYDKLSAIINPRVRFTSMESFKYAGLHLSQQAETFHFSRVPGNVFPADYWYTSFGMHNMILESGLLLDIVFDDTVTSGGIFDYPVFISPFAVALSDKQIGLFERYVEGGGTLVTDRYFGYLDEWGCRAKPGRARKLLGGSSAKPPAPNEKLENYDPGFRVVRRGSGKCIVFNGNPGLAFHRHGNPELCRSFRTLITASAPPALRVEGSPRINLGMYRKTGGLILHIQNSIPWSRSQGFPNPALCEPEPLRKVRIYLKGIEALRVHLPLANPPRVIKFTRKSGVIEFEIEKIGWGEIVEILY